MLLLHLGLSLLALLAILAILASPKGTSTHRLLGRIAAAALVLSALTSFGIQARGHLSALHLLSVVTLVNIPIAIWMVKRGRVAAHKAGMLINAGGLVVAGLFATFAPGRTIYGMLFG